MQTNYLHIKPENLSYAHCISAIDNDITFSPQDAIPTMPSHLQINQDDWNFLYWFINLYHFNSNASPKMILPYITEGGHDKAIDCLITNVKSKKLVVTIYQLKHQKKIGQNEFRKLEEGLQYLLEAESSEINETNIENPILLRAIKKFRKEWKHKTLEVNVYYVAQHDENSVPNSITADKERLMKQFSGPGKKIKIHIIGAQSIGHRIFVRDNSIPSYEISFPILFKKKEGLLVHENKSKKVKSTLISVNAIEFIKSISLYRNSIYSLNVRHLKKSKEGSINDQIYQTSSGTDSGIFWFLNNGITLTCKKIDVTPNPNNPGATIKDPQIVNGLQTCETLFKAFNDNKIKNDCSILLRVIETNNSKFMSKISISTNSQNPVTSRALYANSPEQISLKKEFLNYSFYLQTKDDEYNELLKSEKSKIVKNDLVGQAYLACFLQQPSIALSKKSQVWKNSYDSIFIKGKPTDLILAYATLRLVLTVQKQLKLQPKYADKDTADHAAITYGKFHISKIALHILKHSNPNFDTTKLTKAILDKGDTTATKAIKKSVTILKNLLLKNKDKKHFNYLKSPDIDKVIRKYLYTKFK